MGRTILVFGSRGTIGRTVTFVLATSGWNVLQCGGAADVDLAADGCEIGQLYSKPDAVVHLAAAVPDGRSVIDDADAATRTKKIDAAVANACADWDVPLVYASGTTLYDSSDVTWKTEASSIRARSPYLQAKLNGESLFLNQCRATVIRVSSPVGPGMKPHVVFARMLKSALAGEALQYWGEGSREQDFIWTGDLGDLTVRILDQPTSGIFNAASGRPVSMRELAEIIVRTVGKGTVVANGKPDPQEGASARYDISRTTATFGWEPRTTLQEMIREMIAAGV